LACLIRAKGRTNAAHGVSRACAAGTSLSPIEASEELTYVEIENPGPGVSTWTRAGCSNESANERGDETGIRLGQEYR